MKEIKGHKIRLSLSTSAYKDKEVCNAAIRFGTGDEEQKKLFRKILKQYGLPANQGMSFTIKEMAVHEILGKLILGHSLSHVFEVDKNGRLSKGQKTNANFKEAWFIGIDIDGGKQEMMKYISKLSWSPSFYYTTYSNELPGKGYRFRLGFILNVPIKNIYQFRYVGMLLCDMLERSTGEPIKDKCTMSVAQYMNGTRKDNQNLINFECGMTHNVFELSDFGYSDVGFIQFLKMNCMYKSNDHVENIKKLLYMMTGKHFNWFSRSREFIEVIDEENKDTINQIEDNYSVKSVLSKECETILVFWDRMGNNFKKCAEWNKIREDIDLIWRVEKDGGNERFWVVDKDFFTLPYINPSEKINDENGEKNGVKSGRAKYKDGQGRRKKIYQRMCLRRLMKEGITVEDLIYQTIKDILMFFDNSDGALNSKFIKRNVSRAMSMSVEEIRILFEDDIKVLKEFSQKKYKSARKCSVGELLNKYYDFNKTPQQNLDYLNGIMNLNIGRASVFRWLNKVKCNVDYRLQGSFKDPSNHFSINANDTLDEQKADTHIEVEDNIIIKKDKNMSKKDVKRQVVEEIYNEDNTLSVRKIQTLCEERGVPISRSRVGEIVQELKKADTQKADTQKADTQKADTQKADTNENGTPYPVNGKEENILIRFASEEFPTYNEIQIDVDNECDDWVENILNSVPKEVLEKCKNTDNHKYCNGKL